MSEPHSRSKLQAVIREPLVHFLLLGAAIYGLYALAGPDVEADSDNRIVVSAGEVDWLRTSWEKRWNRPPTPEEQAGLIKEHIRQTVFYREAIAMGLDADDLIIRRRLSQKLEFLVQDLAASVPPTKEELESYFAENSSRYELPTLFTFTHVFVDPDKREDETLADAERIGADLRSLDPPTEGASELGDSFMLQSYYPERDELEISKLFGAEFARTISGLESGSWQGPILSGYGVHWVYVESTTPAELPGFADVRDRVVQDWEDARREEVNEEYYAALLARYEIVIEDDAEKESTGDGSSIAGAPIEEVALVGDAS
jgi:hypothetical protein